MNPPHKWDRSGLGAILPAPVRNVLLSKGFKPTMMSQGLVFTGRMMELPLMGWWVLQETESAWWVAMVGVFRFAPLFAFGIFAGLIADRANRWRVLVTTQAARVLVVAVLLVLIMTDAIEPWHMFLGILALGWTMAAEMPSRKALVLDLVGPQNLHTANTLDLGIITLGAIVGPLMGGVLIDLTGFGGAFLALLLVYALSLFAVTQIRVQVPRIGPSSEPLWQSLVSGLRYSLGNRPILGVLAATVIMNAFGFSFLQLLPVMARDHLNVGAGLMGLLASGFALGQLIGAIIQVPFINIRYHGHIYVLGSMVLLVSVIAFALSPWFPLSYMLLLLGGIGTAGFATMQTTIILLSAAPEMRGRTMGIIVLCIGASPLGILEMGAMAAVLGTQTAIGINAAFAIILWLPILLATPLLSAPLRVSQTK